MPPDFVRRHPQDLTARRRLRRRADAPGGSLPSHRALPAARRDAPAAARGRPDPRRRAAP